MNVTLYGYSVGTQYEWRTNTYYTIGVNNPTTHTRQPDVVCSVDISWMYWVQALDTLLAISDRPCVYLPDGSLWKLDVVGNIEPYDSFYGRVK